MFIYNKMPEGDGYKSAIMLLFFVFFVITFCYNKSVDCGMRRDIYAGGHRVIKKFGNILSKKMGGSELTDPYVATCTNCTYSCKNQHDTLDGTWCIPNSSFDIPAICRRDRNANCTCPPEYLLDGRICRKKAYYASSPDMKPVKVGNWFGS